MPTLLRLADFCGAPRRVLAKNGALRQTQLPVSSTGRGRCVCLLRLANICGGTKALANIGALLRVAVSQIYGAGRGPLVKSRPRSSCAWPIFAARGGARLRKPERCAAGSASAAQPRRGLFWGLLRGFLCVWGRFAPGVPGIQKAPPRRRKGRAERGFPFEVMKGCGGASCPGGGRQQGGTGMVPAAPS